MKTNYLIIISIVFVLTTGCTLLEYESTKTVPAPVAESSDRTEALEARIIELERRVKELEDKLKAQW